jgi:hypothetical protein
MVPLMLYDMVVVVVVEGMVIWWMVLGAIIITFTCE